MEKVEQFITDNFTGNEEYFGELKVKKAIKFLPSHASKLLKFITEIKGDKN